MKHKHTSLKSKMQRNPNKKFKDMKQKQKAKIAEWLYIETFRFYQQNSHMPENADCDAILDTVYNKIKGAAIWIPYEEVAEYYRVRLVRYEERIQRELSEGITYPTRAERKAAEANKPKKAKSHKKKKRKAKLDIPDYSDMMDDQFAYIAGYTSGGAPYGVRWEDAGIPSDLPFDTKKALYMEEYDFDDEE